jgi:hypothetical protein
MPDKVLVPVVALSVGADQQLEYRRYPLVNQTEMDIKILGRPSEVSRRCQSH